jgi:hypothetical protein
MGSKLPRLREEEAKVVPASKPPLAPSMASAGQSSASPWLRAAMLTPSVRDYLTTTRSGKVDLRWETGLLDKPRLSLAMTFTADQQSGMLADRFSGNAVVFLAAVATPARHAERIAARTEQVADIAGSDPRPAETHHVSHSSRRAAHPKPSPIRQALSAIEDFLTPSRGR